VYSIFKERERERGKEGGVGGREGERERGKLIYIFLKM